jgi:hypothetical protein
LGRWDKAGGSYKGGGGLLTLITKGGIPVVQGTQIENNLYKMEVKLCKPNIKSIDEANPQSYVTSKPAQNWGTWHKRFGHIGYNTLQNMLDNNMVNGFNVDTHSPKPDCIACACTEAKQTVEPFDKHTDKETELGDLTHIDLWGKYGIMSINGNQYFLLMVDDASRYNTMEFIKDKRQQHKKFENISQNLSLMERSLRQYVLTGERSSWTSQHGVRNTVLKSSKQHHIRLRKMVLLKG